jgi:hypothetical protein
VPSLLPSSHLRLDARHTHLCQQQGTKSLSLSILPFTIDWQPHLYVNGGYVRQGLQSTKKVYFSPNFIGKGDYGAYSGLADEVWPLIMEHVL